MEKKHIFIVMKRCTYSIIMATLFWCLTSCDEEKDDVLPVQDLIIPEYACSFKIDSNSQGDESVIKVEPYFTNNLDILGCQVKEILYYVDNELVSKETTSPFLLNYRTDALRGGRHLLRTVSVIGGDGFNDGKVEYVSDFLTTNFPSDYQETLDIDFDYDPYIHTNDKIYIPFTWNDCYNAGYKVDGIRYYIDDKLVYTATEPPFDLDYSTYLIPHQKLSLKIELAYSLGYNNSGSWGFSTNIQVLADDETRLYFKHDYSNGYFWNGDIISGKGVVYRGNGDGATYQLNMYLDGRLIESLKYPSYTFSYKIKSVNVGKHELKQEWIKYDSEGKRVEGFHYTQSETINIVK